MLDYIDLYRYYIILYRLYFYLMLSFLKSLYRKRINHNYIVSYYNRTL